MTRASVFLLAVFVCLTLAPSTIAAQPPPQGWVVVSVEEYHALRARATSGPAATPAATGATLTRVDYVLSMEGDTATGRAMLAIDALDDAWARVPVPPALKVRGASMDGQPHALVDGPPPHVLVNRAGRHSIALDIVAAVTASAGTESMTLPSSVAPVTTVTLDLPRTGVDLAVTGGFVREQTPTTNGTRWIVAGVPSQPLTLSWKRRADDRRAALALRYRGRLTSMLGLGEDVSTLTTTVQLDVVQGLAREVTLTVPAGVTVNQVDGPTVADWSSVDGRLRVGFLDPIADAATFVVRSDARLPSRGTVSVPLLRVPEAERESGEVAVNVVGAGEILRHNAVGLEPVDPVTLGEMVTGRDAPSLVAFRLRPVAGTDTRGLDVSVERYTPQAVLVANVEEARVRALATDHGPVLVEARYAVRNNQRSFLKVSLPPGSTVWGASVGGQAVRPGVAEQDAVLIPLEKGRAGDQAPTFVVELAYLQQAGAWPTEGAVALALPTLDLPVSRTGIELFYSPRYRIALTANELRVETDNGPTAEALRGGRAHTPIGVVPVSAVSQGFQSLIDRHAATAPRGIRASTAPVQVEFPDVGPSIFAAAELLPEHQRLTLDLTVRRTR